MRSELFASLRLVGITIVACVVAYPLGILALAAVAASDARMGSLIVNSEGRVVGSRLVAQGFSKPEYFWPRPSAVDYNAAAAGGSNLSPANPAIPAFTHLPFNVQRVVCLRQTIIASVSLS